MGRLHLVIDQSGSMHSMVAPVYEGARELLEDVAEDGTVCVTRFSSDVALGTDMTPATAHDQWNPGECSGTTALYDAITAAIDHDMQHHAELRSLTIAIVTDGIENASRTSSLEEVKTKIEDSTAKGWRIVFLGSNQDAVLTAKTMGIERRHSMTYGHSADEARGAFRSLQAANRRWQRGEDESFTFSERLQAHAAHTAPEPAQDSTQTVNLGFDPQIPGQAKWISLDPRSDALTKFDEAISADLEKAHAAKESQAEIRLVHRKYGLNSLMNHPGVNAVVFFDSGGEHVQKTKKNES